LSPAGARQTSAYTAAAAVAARQRQVAEGELTMVVLFGVTTVM